MKNRSPLFVASVAAAGLGMVMYDNTSITVALPSIRESFGTDTGSLQWLLNALSLMTATMLPFSGALGDRLGPKRCFQAGLLIFATFALLGSFSTSIGMLITCRALQGFGGALLLPNAGALLSANVAEEFRTKTVGLWISISSIGLVVGPIGGGILIQNFGWHAALFGQTPIALFGAWRIRYLNDGPRRDTSLDVKGILTASLSTLALCAGLIQLGRNHANYPIATGLVVAGVALLILFYRIEHKVEHPLIHPTWLTDVRTRGVLLASMIYNGTIAAATFIISILTQTSRALSPLMGGVIIWLSCLFMPLGSRITGSKSTLSHLRKVMLGGSIGLVAGYLIISSVSQAALPMLLVSVTISGLCAGLLFSGDTIAILRVIEPDKASSGLAALSLVRQIGAVFGIALFGSASEWIARAGTTVANARSITIALCALGTIPCYFLLRLGLKPTALDEASEN